MAYRGTHQEPKSSRDAKETEPRTQDRPPLQEINHGSLHRSAAAEPCLAPATNGHEAAGSVGFPPVSEPIGSAGDVVYEDSIDDGSAGSGDVVYDDSADVGSAGDFARQIYHVQNTFVSVDRNAEESRRATTSKSCGASPEPVPRCNAGATEEALASQDVFLPSPERCFLPSELQSNTWPNHLVNLGSDGIFAHFEQVGDQMITPPPLIRSYGLTPAPVRRIDFTAVENGGDQPVTLCLSQALEAGPVVPIKIFDHIFPAER